MKSAAELGDEVASLRAEIRRLRLAFRDLTPSLAALLRRRGFRIHRMEPADDLLIPAQLFLDDYYRLMQRYSFRLFLRDVIRHQERFTLRDVARYATAEVTGDYVDALFAMRLIKEDRTGGGYRLRKRPVKSFGPTLEWFVAEVLRREFSAEAFWGVKFKRTAVGGDYDIVAKIDGALMAAEVKSSPPKQIYSREVSAFLDRLGDLRPEIAVFLMDTELRMKDKIVPLFEEELRRRAVPGTQPLPVERIEKELFHIGEKTFIINAKESIAGNIEKILRRYFRRST